MKINKGKLAVFSLIVNGVFVLFFAGKRVYYTHSSPGVSWGDLWDQDRTDVFEALPITSRDIVFVGNSLTEGFPLAEMFPGMPVKNRGILGNESRHIVRRIGEIATRHPQKVFIEMGINDIIAKLPVDTVFEHFKETVKIIRSISPQTLIYIHSITPGGMTYRGNQPSIVKLNGLLKDFCREEKVQFIDLYPLLYKNGGLDSSLTYDGIHLNGKGYEIWKNKIAPFVN